MVQPSEAPTAGARLRRFFGVWERKRLGGGGLEFAGISELLPGERHTGGAGFCRRLLERGVREPVVRGA